MQIQINNSTLDIRLVACDSSHVEKGDLFICKGVSFKPAYLADALKRGAVAWIASAERAGELLAAVPEAADVPHMSLDTEDDVRSYMNKMSAQAALAHLADEKLKLGVGGMPVVGITGTKGKTTCSNLLVHIIDEARGDKQSGIMGTNIYWDGVREVEAHNTTPEAPDLWYHVCRATETRRAAMVMEVSSQALKYGRVLGLPLDIGCFLNIGHDHISPVEHPNFEDYFASKLKIFDQSRVAVVNLGVEHAAEMLAHARASKTVEKVVTFLGAGAAQVDAQADWWVEDVSSDLGAIKFTLKGANGTSSPMKLSMMGLFNLDNALAAIVMAQELGISLEVCARALAHVQVDGRMMFVKTNNPRLAGLIDYAHNGMSFNALFSSLAQELPNYEFMAVFGATGSKAEERRREMGEVVSKYCKAVLLTEDDPMYEDNHKVMSEIAEWIVPEVEVKMETDRELAIDKAVAWARDLLASLNKPLLMCILGKGVETYTHRGDVYIDRPSDLDLLKRAFEKYGLSVID